MSAETNWGMSSADNAVRVMIADDHTMILEMVALLLGNTPGVQLATAGDVAQVLARIAEDGPFDLILLDLDMPGMDGLDGLRVVMEANGGKPVGIITGGPTPRVIEEANAMGAAGLISKTTSMRSLSNAIRFMAAGERYFPLELMREQEEVQQSIAVPLTKRELSVLGRLADGMQNREIGEALDLAEPTIKMHVKSICRKLGVSNRTQAVIAGRKLKLV